MTDPTSTTHHSVSPFLTMTDEFLVQLTEQANQGIAESLKGDHRAALGIFSTTIASIQQRYMALETTPTTTPANGQESAAIAAAPMRMSHPRSVRLHASFDRITTSSHDESTASCVISSDTATANSISHATTTSSTSTASRCPTPPGQSSRAHGQYLMCNQMLALHWQSSSSTADHHDQDGLGGEEFDDQASTMSDLTHEDMATGNTNAIRMQLEEEFADQDDLERIFKTVLFNLAILYHSLALDLDARRLALTEQDNCEAASSDPPTQQQRQPPSVTSSAIQRQQGMLLSKATSLYHKIHDICIQDGLRNHRRDHAQDTFIEREEAASRKQCTHTIEAIVWNNLACIFNAQDSLTDDDDDASHHSTGVGSTRRAELCLRRLFVHLSSSTGGMAAATNDNDAATNSMGIDDPTTITEERRRSAHGGGASSSSPSSSQPGYGRRRNQEDVSDIHTELDSVWWSNISIALWGHAMPAAASA